jgi:tetratricopeptide (TPR) repeat protein/DNA-binding CsgD family transcriptional regulator/TolB-like protein
MKILARPRRRAGSRGPLRVENGDAFSGLLEKYGITAREGEIIRLLLEGRDNKAITRALFISDHTVKNHIHHIYRKLEIRNRIQLVQRFRDALEPPGPAGAGAPPGGPERRLAWPRNVFPALIAVGLVVAGLVIWKPWSPARRPEALKPVLAVLDFENLSPDPDFNKWTAGFPLLLTTDLSQSRSIRTLTDDAVFGALRKLGLIGSKRYSRDDLRRLAAELKADYLLTGTLMKAGDRILVTAVLQDARTGDLVKTEKAECAGEVELMRRADTIARAVGSAVRPAGAEESVTSRVETLTTSSPLAYKYFAEGRRYHHTGDYAQSLLMLRQAVELDPNFAMAYRDMSVNSRNLDDFSREAEYMKKAFDLSGNLPEHSRERWLIRGDYFSLSEATLGRAAEAFARGLEDFPDDPLMTNSLAMLDYDLEDFEAAVNRADVRIRQGTDDPFPYHTKAAALMALGRFSEAEGVLTAYHAGHPASRLIFETQAAVLLEARQFAKAEALLGRAEAVFPGPAWAYWRGTVLFQTLGAEAAAPEFQRLLQLGEQTIWPIQARQRLGSLALSGGRLNEAADQFRKGAELADSTGQLVWTTTLRRLLGQVLLAQENVKGAIVEGRKAVEAAAAAAMDYRMSAALIFLAGAHFRDNDDAAVGKLARRMEALAQADGTRRMRRQLLVFQGLTELEKGHPREAVGLFEQAEALLVRKDGRDVQVLLVKNFLARARERSGDLAGAAASFEEIIHSPGYGPDFNGLLAEAVLGLARVEEKLGRPAPALEHYRRFLELWKDADPGRPEIRLAEEKVAALAEAQGR